MRIASLCVFCSLVIVPSAFAHDEHAQHGAGQCGASGKGGKEQCAAKSGDTAGAASVFDKMPPAGTKARCHVTGEAITVDARTLSSTHKGKVHLFCCPGCKSQFDAAPEKFTKPN